MRKITQEAVSAFLEGRKYSKDNTTVTNEGLFLHSNKIAEYTSIYQDCGKAINITLAGWNTNTTRERLNGLPNVKVTSKKGQAYLNGEKWDGSWITVIIK